MYRESDLGQKKKGIPTDPQEYLAFKEQANEGKASIANTLVDSSTLFFHIIAIDY